MGGACPQTPLVMLLHTAVVTWFRQPITSECNEFDKLGYNVLVVIKCFLSTNQTHASNGLPKTQTPKVDMHSWCKAHDDITVEDVTMTLVLSWKVHVGRPQVTFALLLRFIIHVARCCIFNTNQDCCCYASSPPPHTHTHTHTHTIPTPTPTPTHPHPYPHIRMNCSLPQTAFLPTLGRSRLVRLTASI